MKCVEFQNEFEEQNALSEAAETHLFHCKDCQKFESNQNRVWEMLGGLGRVEAPKDFNFRVRSRIAEGKPNGFGGQTSFFPALRFVMPIGFVVVLLSFVALSGLYFVDTQTPPPVATGQTPEPSGKIVEQDQTVPAEDQFTVNNEPIQTAEDSKQTEIPEGGSETIPEKPNLPEVAKKQTVVGGSRDSNEGSPRVFKLPNDEGNSSVLSARKEKKVITPEGFGTSNKPKKQVNSDDSKPIDVKEILKLSGIESEFDNDELKVLSIRKNSLAERSKVEVGDVIEAINGKKITGEPLRGKTIEVNSITVLRGGNRKLIKLKAN